MVDLKFIRFYLPDGENREICLVSEDRDSFLALIVYLIENDAVVESTCCLSSLEKQCLERLKNKSGRTLVSCEPEGCASAA